MQNTLNVAVMQSPGRLASPQSRIDWLDTALQALHDRPVDLVVLPELFLTGYNIGDKLTQRAEERDGAFSRQIADLARSSELAIHFGYAEQDGSRFYNSAACYDKTGVMTGHHRKLILPPGFELNHFTPGNCYSQFQLGGFNIATLICYDAEFPEAFREVSVAGADLVVVPTALGAQWEVVSERVIPTRAFENGVYVCYANHCDQENGLQYHGGSCIVGPDGKDLARALRVETYLFATLELAKVGSAQLRLPYHVDRLKLPDTGSTIDIDR